MACNVFLPLVDSSKATDTCAHRKASDRGSDCSSIVPAIAIQKREGLCGGLCLGQRLQLGRRPLS